MASWFWMLWSTFLRIYGLLLKTRRRRKARDRSVRSALADRDSLKTVSNEQKPRQAA